MSRILVTGASGFVGGPALRALAARGHDLHAASRNGGRDSEGARWHEADLLEPGAAAALIEDVRPERLLHLAWFAEHGAYWTAPENRDWVRASRDLLEAFAAAGGERAVVAGTCAEYDWSADGDCREGDTPLRPSTLYGEAKLELSTAAGEIAGRTGLSLAWARLFFLFGPGEHPDRLVASVARHVIAGEPAPCSAGTQVRDFLYVEDAGDALAALLDSPVEGPVNVGSGEPVTIAELVGKVAAAAGDAGLLDLGALPAPEDDPPRLAADVTRLRDEVGWRPQTDLDDAVARTVAWWRERLPSR
jgi:nucleoside-diphosphate-sugar epimerase